VRVVVVGGGILGLVTAREILRTNAGRKVVVATEPSELERLARLQERAAANEVAIAEEIVERLGL
jgi:L-2-hydroxyglutarate oxidase LhgO